MALMLTIFNAKSENAYQTYLTAAKGWEQVTDLSSMTLNNYYFAIVSNDNTDLMVKMDKAKSDQQATNHSMWYKNAKDPLKDNSYLWMLENNNTEGYVGYTIRNVDRPVRVIQTNENNPWFARTNWETGPVRWTSYAFNIDNGVYSIKALANGGDNYLGLWVYSNGYVNNQELAGNKYGTNGAEVGKFLLFAIPKTTANAAIAAVEDASSSAPYDLAPSLFGRYTSDYSGATGYYGDYRYLEKYTNTNEGMAVGDKVTKTITNAPNGYHQITVIVNAAWIAGRGLGDTPPETHDNSTVVTINGESKNVPVRTDGGYNPVTLTFNTLVTDGNISFAITNNDAAAFWFVWDIDDVFCNTSEALENLHAQIVVSQEIYDNSTCSDASARSAFGTAISTANSKTVMDATDEDVETLLTATRTYERVAYPTDDYSFDMTWLLPGVTTITSSGTSNPEGWNHDITISNFRTHWVNGMAGDAGTNYFLESYRNTMDEGWAAYQQAVLPEGAYKLEAYAFQRNPANRVVLAAGNNESCYINSGDGSNGGLRLYSTPFYSDGTNASKMGIKVLEAGKNDWVGINKIKLYKVADSYTSALTTLIATCNSYANHSTSESEDLTTFQSAITEAGKAESTASAQAAAYETLELARRSYVLVADPDEGYPFDMTYLLKTPDLTGKRTWQSIYGWTTDQTDGNFQVMQNNSVDAVDGIHKMFMEYWSHNAKSNNEFNIYTTVENLPEGTYTMNCYAFAKQQDGETGKTPIAGLYFYANDTQGTIVNDNRLTQKSISFVNATEQDVKIGLKPMSTGNTYNWMGIGYVELYKVHAQEYELNENNAWDYEQSGAGKVEVTRTIKEGVNTVVFPFSMTQDEVEDYFGEGSVVYQLSSYEGETIHFITRSGISANEPCLVKATSAANSAVAYTLNDRTVVAAANASPSVAGTNVTMTGTYAASTKVAQSNNYIVSDGNLYIVNSDNVYVKNTRAYITLSTPNPEARLVISFDDEDPTAINAIEAEDAEDGALKDGKYLIDGKIVIVKNGVKYSANGQILK